MSFYCKMGSVETTTKFESPTFDRVQSWYNEWILVDGATEYIAYLVGNFPEITFGKSNIPTMDVDVALVGQIKDFDKLETILNAGISIGFKYKLLIDILWVTELMSIINYVPVNTIKSYDKFYRKETFDDGDDIIVDLSYGGPNVKQIIDTNLYFRSYQSPPSGLKKKKNRCSTGIYEDINVDMATIDWETKTLNN